MGDSLARVTLTKASPIYNYIRQTLVIATIRA